MSTEGCFDYVVVGSGFGGSVSAMRLTEKGYRVLVLEQGKRFADNDYPTTNWKVWKFLWMPAARFFGIMQISPFQHVLVLHGSGVGGGSLCYANVLMEPDEKAFSSPAWKKPLDWRAVLAPYYQTAKRMLGVAPNPNMWKSDEILQEIAADLGRADTFRVTEGGVFYGEPGLEVPDPYFGGEGPTRTGCTQCGGCMVGCRYNAKNSLDKNYLYFAEKWGAEIWSEKEVRNVVPLAKDQPDGARYEVFFRSSTAWFSKPEERVRTRNVVFSGGTLGTLKLLFRCRDATRTLPNLSPRLGELVRTNSESLLGASAKDRNIDYSEGIAITSIFNPDDVTAIEPVRYPAGSSMMRLLAGPMGSGGNNLLFRLMNLGFQALRHPVETIRILFQPHWSERTTILLVMQTEDNRIHFKLGRSLYTLFRLGLVSKPDREQNIPSKIPIGHHVTRELAQKIDGFPASSINESVLDIPLTAHILGGCTFGETAQEGVIDLNCQVHNYPGLYVVDGSIMPANPGVNPSLTITALAEYAMASLPSRNGKLAHKSKESPKMEKMPEIA
jgi:cholesterol oxidase